MAESEKVKFTNAKFGEVEVERADLLTFPSGLPGFERCRQYGLLALEEEEPFVRMLSTEEPAVGFVLVNPMLIWADYDPQLSREDLEGLEITAQEEMAVYCIVTLHPDPLKVTANLKGPIFINTRTMRARQLILVDERYHTKHAILAAGQENPRS